MASHRLITERSQQTIVQTTHFFSTNPSFGVNTQFSEDLHNILIISHLHSQPNIQRSTFNLSSCGWACFVVRNMPIRKAIHGLSQRDTLAFATRKMPNGTSSAQHARWKGKIPPFRSLVLSKIRHNFLTKRPDKAPHGHRQKNHGRLVAHVRSVYLLDRCLLRYFNPNRSLDRKKR